MKKTIKTFLLLILITLMVFTLTACDSGGSGQTSESYSVNLKVEFLTEEEINELEVMVGDKSYTDLEDNYNNGTLNLKVQNLQSQKKITVAHSAAEADKLHFHPESITVNQNDAGSTIGFYTKYFILDRTIDERYDISDIDPDFLKSDHEYVVYPGEHKFDYDLEITKPNITITSKTGRDNTLINLSNSNSRVLIDADDITIRGLTIDINEDEISESIFVNENNKNIEIENNNLEGIKLMSNLDNIMIVDNLIHDSLTMGIHAGSDNNNIQIIDNEIYNNSLAQKEKEEHGYEGIYVHQNLTDLKIEENIIRDNFGEGIVLNENIKAAIENNEITNNSFSGIIVAHNSNAQIRNNLIAENAYTLDDENEQASMYVRGINLYKSEATIENNFIQENEHEGILIDESQAEIAYNKIENNIRGIFILGETAIEQSNIQMNNITINTREEIIAVIINENNELEIYENSTLKAENNYFGRSELIESTTEDYLVVDQDGEDIMYGNIDYQPYEKSPITEAGIE